MTTLRSINLNRALYWTKCRRKLSDHICTIQPSSGQHYLLTKSRSDQASKVRLITKADDPYTWRILPEKQYLFKKHLSKHSIGAYRELCREVGVSFEAVLAPESSNAAEGKLLEERRGAMVGAVSSAQP